jgi:hypothetical protein
MPILGIPFTWMGAGSSHSINKAKEVGPRSTKAVGYRHQYSGCIVTVLQLNWVRGIMKVAMWLCTPLLVGL